LVDPTSEQPGGARARAPGLPGIWITRLDDAEPGRRLAVKDLFDTAGVRTTYGSAVFREHVPERTATAVERLEAAGWHTVGKTNLHEFAYGITSHNEHFGDVPNPRFPGRVAGGSSGGSAAALATGEADLALGTDTGGSIRIPAACCEVVGFKPSFGLVPLDGCFPLAPSFDHAGPLANDVATCIDAMRALAPELAGPVARSLADLEIGVAWLEAAEAPVAAAVEAALERLPRIRPLELPRPVGVLPAFHREVAEVHRDLYAERREDYGHAVGLRVATSLDVDDELAGSAREAREAYRRAFADAIDKVDLVVVPTLPVVPPPLSIDELSVRDRLTENTFPFNAVGAPALALPAGRTRDGLPVSLQLVGRPGDDALVLGAGLSIERALAE
jgi:aspartyl-tRNA(Asn)/glutamyl-tRNA(Gln) amidotransferase subunit A